MLPSHPAGQELPLTPETATPQADPPAPIHALREAQAAHDVQALHESQDAHVDALSALLLHRLDDDKAQDVILIDLKGKSPLADSIVVASGRSQRHVASMADHLLRALKDNGFGRAQVEGLPQADWVLIDAGDVIVHLFRPEVRAFYNIEKIWSVEPPRASDPPQQGFAAAVV